MGSGATKMPMTARPGNALKGTLTVPGDKSISHRALMLATLAAGRSQVRGLLEGEDVLSTANAMRALGAAIERRGDGTWIIDGPGVGALTEPDDVVDYGNAGTGVRLAMGVAAAYDMAVTFTGDASLRGRPMGRVLRPLEAFGARALCRSGERLPLTIRGAARALPARYDVPVPSAQVKSAALLCSVSTEGDSQVIETISTRDHTERMLKGFGAAIDVAPRAGGGAVITLSGGRVLRPQNLIVPADPSSAAFLVVAALVTPGSDVTLTGVLLNPTRAGLFETLIEMGADLSIHNRREEGGETVGDLVMRHSALVGITVPADRAPSMIDEYPVLAVAAAFATGTTRMEGLEELRVKESDRLAAVAAGLAANGIAHRTGPDWLEVTGTGSAPRGGGTVVTHLDHRIAMSFLVLGLAAREPVHVDDGAPIATSFPEFMDLMRRLGGDLSAEGGMQGEAGEAR